MFRVLAKWQKTGAKMADFCGILDARKVSDESNFSFIIKGNCQRAFGRICHTLLYGGVPLPAPPKGDTP